MSKPALQTMFDVHRGFGFHNRIAIVLMKENYFFRNTSQLKGFSYLYEKSLQKEGYQVITVSMMAAYMNVLRFAFVYLWLILFILSTLSDT